MSVLLRPRYLAVALAALFAGCAQTHNPDALWQLISQQCVPDQQHHQQPAPCQQVDLARGYVTIKDRHGDLQYLLLPTNKITGMESPKLLEPTSPRFFALAWQHRGLMAAKRGKAVPEEAISLAINSERGRTQNQLHVHISCLLPEVRTALDRQAPSLGQTWRQTRLAGHHYLLRTLSTEELAEESVFIRLAKEVPGARESMGDYGMAMAALPSGQLVLMATKAGLFSNASAEELQDHDCAILK
ncbi:CDP-diacylglycerol diphosphatase [Gallaecimonas kandeliae]|uniref:CDP-diacylglycerol diphosphatase n=1 Tax=Gallaecimonas kandeliae TaxID=3029055 RepID=UPI0026484202|nr:CDP-diacylglycerol diphosphatase [Gallaecimonas kandeliae]WKE64615.1 CDP-diacylglycerol diphosphatase [Gallaecimonas kandeliae]